MSEQLWCTRRQECFAYSSTHKNSKRWRKCCNHYLENIRTNNFARGRMHVFKLAGESYGLHVLDFFREQFPETSRKASDPQKSVQARNVRICRLLLAAFSALVLEVGAATEAPAFQQWGAAMTRRRRLQHKM